LGISESTENGYYTLVIDDGANATTFDATATAVGAQVADSTCASLSIDAQGNKTATKSGGSASTVCWD
jgi:type IV pilus assembly protein PilE